MMLINIIAIILKKKVDSGKYEKIMKDPVFGIAIVTKFKPGKKNKVTNNSMTQPMPAIVYYKFIDDTGKERKCIDSIWGNEELIIAVGSKYHVVYLKTKPQKNQILLNRPI
jgi:hypothetical protein